MHGGGSGIGSLMWFAITDNTRSLEGCVCFGFIMWHHFWYRISTTRGGGSCCYILYDKSIVHSGKYIIIFSNKYAVYTLAPIGGKINQCHFGDLRVFFGAPNICTNLCTDFRGGAKKQPVPWHGGTG